MQHDILSFCAIFKLVVSNDDTAFAPCIRCYVSTDSEWVSPSSSPVTIKYIVSLRMYSAHILNQNHHFFRISVLRDTRKIWKKWTISKTPRSAFWLSTNWWKKNLVFSFHINSLNFQNPLIFYIFFHIFENTIFEKIINLTLDSFYRNFYSFYTNQMGITLRFTVFISHYVRLFFILNFDLSYFSIFKNAPKVVQKRTYWKKKHTKC